MKILVVIAIVLIGCNTLAIVPDKERTDLDSKKKEILFYKTESGSCSGVYIKKKSSELTPSVKRKRGIGVRCHFSWLNFTL